MVKLFKRKIYSKLVEWKNRSNGETAILIEGARRIGKTSVAKEFGKNEFSDYLLIDFSVASSVVLSLFDDLFNIDIFFERLFLAFGIKPLDKGSLIIFDETFMWCIAVTHEDNVDGNRLCFISGTA